jgi:hypothetical protein
MSRVDLIRGILDCARVPEHRATRVFLSLDLYPEPSRDVVISAPDPILKDRWKSAFRPSVLDAVCPALILPIRHGDKSIKVDILSPRQPVDVAQTLRKGQTLFGDIPVPNSRLGRFHRFREPPMARR